MDALINSSTIVPSIPSIIVKLQVRTKIQRPPPPSSTDIIKLFKAENQQILTFFQLQAQNLCYPLSHRLNGQKSQNLNLYQIDKVCDFDLVQLEDDKSV